MGGARRDAKRAREAAEQQLEMQKAENARIKATQEAERRDIDEAMIARRRAKLRGGSRMLLSAARVAPESGVETLGTANSERA